MNDMSEEDVATVFRQAGRYTKELNRITGSKFGYYGRSHLTANEMRRARWYDTYLFLLMHTECDYRGYDTTWHYDWSGEMIEKCTGLLEEKQ